jgi:hypothetical protein
MSFPARFNLQPSTAGHGFTVSPQTKEANMARIKALLDFSDNAPGKAVNRGNAVYTGMNGNANLTQPPVEMPVLRTEIDTVSASIAAALDGGRKAVALRNEQTAVLCASLRHLAHYVEAACKGDMTIFISSGFQPASASRMPIQFLSQFIRRIDTGLISGEMIILLAAVAGALSYEFHWAQMTNGTPGQWTTRLVAKTQPRIVLSGLTPGTTYAFGVRVLTSNGYSDWSDSITKMCV